jgi:two-component system chemotaxis response regulator CheB
MTVRVLVIDDSPFMRGMLTSLLEVDNSIKVVATAKDSYEAREKIKMHNPDVITLDIQMPKMNGLAFLDRLMRLRPMPVVMVSTITQNGADATLLALELGAVDFVAKPQSSDKKSLEDMGADIRAKVIEASKANVNPLGFDEVRVASSHNQPALYPAPDPGLVIAMAASTGGVEAFHTILTSLPMGLPPILIAQHMPKGFTHRFADRLNRIIDADVQEARDGEELVNGMIRVAPGDIHMEVKSDGSKLKTVLHQGDLVSGHRPSADVLFRSVAQTAGIKSIGIVMTGMGRDGAQGLKAMRDAGARTFVQDAKTCLVAGMPRAALKLDAAEKVALLEDIPSLVVSAIQSFKVLLPE